jgi:hypothetical protein
MPRKRKTVQEKEIEKLITKHLDKLGEVITTDSANDSRVRTGDLRDSQNFRTRPYNVLTVSQNYYGKFIYPKDKGSGEKNALAISVKKNVPAGVQVLMRDMIDLLKSPIVTKK